MLPSRTTEQQWADPSRQVDSCTDEADTGTCRIMQAAPENMVCWQPLLALDCVVSRATAALHPVIENDLHTRSKAASKLKSLVAMICAGQAGASMGATCDDAMQSTDMQQLDGGCLQAVQGEQL